MDSTSTKSGPAGWKLLLFSLLIIPVTIGLTNVIFSASQEALFSTNPMLIGITQSSTIALLYFIYLIRYRCLLNEFIKQVIGFPSAVKNGFREVRDVFGRFWRGIKDFKKKKSSLVSLGLTLFILFWVAGSFLIAIIFQPFITLPLLTGSIAVLLVIFVFFVLIIMVGLVAIALTRIFRFFEPFLAMVTIALGIHSVVNLLVSTTILTSKKDPQTLSEFKLDVSEALLQDSSFSAFRLASFLLALSLFNSLRIDLSQKGKRFPITSRENDATDEIEATKIDRFFAWLIEFIKYVADLRPTSSSLEFVKRTNISYQTYLGTALLFLFIIHTIYGDSLSDPRRLFLNIYAHFCLWIISIWSGLAILREISPMKVTVFQFALLFFGFFGITSLQFVWFFGNPFGWALILLFSACGFVALQSLGAEFKNVHGHRQ